MRTKLLLVFLSLRLVIRFVPFTDEKNSTDEKKLVEDTGPSYYCI